ncbi:MAG: MFS transporter [Blautia sp.]|nr:MFS transporter [Blautia sp.]
MDKFFDNPALKSKIRSQNVKIDEMLIGYFLAPFAAMIANSIFGAYLTRYYNDVLGWGALAGGIFSAALPIVSCIFVVAGNLLIGQRIDQTRTRAGKSRPYLLLSIPILAVAILLMFMVPRGSGDVVQMVCIALTYNLYYAIGYPCYYTAHSSMVSLSTRNANQRGILATLSNASMVAAAGVGASILAPILLQSYMFVTNAETGVLDIDASYTHWKILAVCFAVITALGVILEFFFTRERITEEAANLDVKEEKIPMKQHVGACTKEKLWWMVILYILIFQMGQLVKNASMATYVRWMFDSVISSPNPESASGNLMGVLGLIGGLPSAVGMVIAWPLASKLGKKRAIIIGLAFSLIGGLVAFMNVHNFTTVCTGVILKAIGIIPSQYVMVAVLSDVLDHLEAKNGFRSDGFTMSIYGAIQVGLLGLSIGIVSGVLSATGYNATLVRQAPATEGVMVFVYLMMDMISFAVAILCLARMNVEKFLDEDQKLIVQHQKEAVLANGGTWIEPEERQRLEQEEAERMAEEARKAELKALCEKKGLNFEEEEKKYQEKLAYKKEHPSLIDKLLG